jgi:hypothetical protein
LVIPEVGSNDSLQQLDELPTGVWQRAASLTTWFNQITEVCLVVCQRGCNRSIDLRG